MSAWRAIFCKPQKEQTALVGIRGLGVPTWFPHRLVRRWTPERKAYRIRLPYFPGYIFADLDGFASVSVKVSGVEAILGEVPIPLPVMQTLFALADAEGRIIEPPLKRGELIPTPLPGVLAEFDHLDRNGDAAVLVRLFGTVRPATLPAIVVARHLAA